MNAAPMIGQEGFMIAEVEDVLLPFINSGEDAQLISVPGPTATSRIFKLQRDDGAASKIPIIILEVRPPNQGGDMIVQHLRSNYARHIAPLLGTAAHARTHLPAIGMELIGFTLRIHALLFTTHVQSELLREDQFPDIWIAQRLPQSTEQPARTLTALKQYCHNLCQKMAAFREI